MVAAVRASIFAYGDILLCSFMPDWGVQAIVSWLLSNSFHDENISIVAEEDDETLSSSNGAALLESVVVAVNGCLVEAPKYGLRSPEKELGAHDVIQAIRKCSSAGGPKGRFWVLDPVDGTLGFVRGDQYAIALALIEDGEVILGVLGCPNYPMKKEWLNYHQKYYRLMSKVAPPPLGSWHKGCVMYAQKGCGQAWMQPLVHDFGKLDWAHPREIQVSSISDPMSATFCEPVEKANSSHSFTAGLAHSVGLRSVLTFIFQCNNVDIILPAWKFIHTFVSGMPQPAWDKRLCCCCCCCCICE